MTANRQKRAKDRGKSNEYRIVKKLKSYGLDAERVPLSGAIESQPGDILVKDLDLLIESKVYAVYQTVSGGRYIRFDLNWYDKIKQEAKSRGLTHAAVFVRGEHLQQDYVIISSEEYLELRGIRTI